MVIERQRVRHWPAVLAILLASSASAHAEDPPAAEAKGTAPKAVRHVGGDQGAKVEAKHPGEPAEKSAAGMPEHAARRRAGHGHEDGDAKAGKEPPGMSRAAEPAKDGDERAEAKLSPEERAQRRLERGKHARQTYWRMLMQQVRSPSEIPPSVRNELRHHGRRLARLQRIKMLAEDKHDKKAIARIEKLMAHEHERHGRKMHEQVTALAPGKAAAPGAAPAPGADTKPAGDTKAADDPDPEGTAAEEEEQGAEP